MIPNVQTALDAILKSAAVLQHASGAGRIFELFVMTSIARRLKDHGYQVWLQRSDGTRMNSSDTDKRFIQRGGAPTGVAGAAQGPNNASSMVFQYGNGQKWEIWNGILFTGRSGATHEIDLAVVPANVGRRLRGRVNGGTPTGRPRIAIECKDVGTPGSVDEMRAFIARLYDITLLQAHHKYLSFQHERALHPASPNAPEHRPCLTYRQENKRTKNIIARRTGFVAGAAFLAEYHVIEPHADITVGSTNADELADAVATWITSRGY